MMAYFLKYLKERKNKKMNNSIYYIETGNRHGQILLFTSYKKAFYWLKCATRLQDEEIKKHIKKAYNIGGNYQTIFI